MHLEIYGMWQQQQQHQQAYLRGLPPQHPQQQTLHPGIIGTDNHASHQPHQQHHHQHHRPTIMDLPVPSNPRASRNMAEKQRRDNLNHNITAMASLVPSVAGSSRRMDKISILRLATTYLRTQYTLGSGSMNFLSSLFRDQFDLEQFIVDNLVDSRGFLLVVTATGKIIYVSRQVEQHLGHVQNELLGQSLYNFIYPEDHDELTRNLTPDGMQPISAPSPTGIAQVAELAHDNNSSSSEDSSTTNHRTNERIKRFREQRRQFKLRMAQRTTSRRDHTQYECFDISGLLRLAIACKNADTNGNRGRQRETSTGTSNDIVFAGVATLPKKRPITDLSIMDANKDEYVTRHLVDGRIIYCDHRVSVVAGYMAEEVSGLNAFAFMHKDDFRWTMIGLRQMYDRAETCGSSCYRLLTKTGEFIYLRTHGYLEFDKDTQTVESFVCVNTLVSEEEGIQLIKEMKIRFSATTVSASSKGLIRATDINSPIELISNSQSSNPRCSLEEKAQLEDAITHLISDLPSPAISEGRFSPSPMPNTQFMKAAIFSSRMPPAAAQANKIGINKIDRCIVMSQGKDKVTPKQESKHTGKLINPNAEQSPISDSEMPSGKPLSMFEMMNATPNTSHGNVQNTDMTVQSKILARKSGKSPRASRNHTSCLDVPQNAKVLNAQERIDQPNVTMLSPSAPNEGNIKVERGIEETSSCLEKQESILQYFNDSANDNSTVLSRIEMHNRYQLKRICSDNLLAMRAPSKKRLNDVYASSMCGNANNETEHISYLKCKSFAAAYPFSDGINQCNDINSQLTMAKSPNSSLHEGTDYQQFIDPTMSLVVTNHDKEQFIDLQEDMLNSKLTNPELAIDIFTINNGSADFNTFNAETKTLSQNILTFNDQVNDALSRTHNELKDKIAFQESEINVLARNFKDHSALHTYRKNVSQLQAEVNIEKQMLKTLQQDCKMQVNAKQKLGI